MTPSQNRLKTDLKIKYLSKRLDEAVEWNFGYSPTDSKDFDACLTELNTWLEHARVHYEDLYKKWMAVL